MRERGPGQQPQDQDAVTPYGLSRITAAAAPRLLAITGVGLDVASTLLLTAGDNPDRLHSERSFAALCGSSPIPASSGKTNRHRLNRGGDRQANAALWRVAMVRLAVDPTTKAYLARRVAEGKTKVEAIRCLKRYIAREVYNALPRTSSRLTVGASLSRIYSPCRVTKITGLLQQAG